MPQPTPDAERTAWLGQHAMRLICSAIDNDPDEASRLIGEIGERYGLDGIFGTCYSLAEAVRVWAFPQLKRGDGSLTGDMLAIERLPGASDDPASLWAAQFLAAYVNGDSSTTTALFFGQLDNEDLILGGVAALIGMVGSIGREVQQERAS